MADDHIKDREYAMVLALARRLREIGGDHPSTLGSHALAREVLRQMEWARRRGIRFGLVARGLRQGLVTDSASGELEINEMAAHDPLTLAPDGWRADG